MHQHPSCTFMLERVVLFALATALSKVWASRHVYVICYFLDLTPLDALPSQTMAESSLQRTTMW